MKATVDLTLDRVFRENILRQLIREIPWRSGLSDHDLARSSLPWPRRSVQWWGCPWREDPYLWERGEAEMKDGDDMRPKPWDAIQWTGERARAYPWTGR